MPGVAGSEDLFSHIDGCATLATLGSTSETRGRLGRRSRLGGRRRSGRLAC